MKTVSDLDTIRTIVDAAWFLSSEATLHFRPDGLVLNVVDDANAGLVNIQAPVDAFSFYEVPEPVDVSVELGKFSEMLGSAKKGEPVSLAINETSKSLEIQTGKLTFSLRLLSNSIVKVCPEVPDLKFTGMVAIDPDDFVVVTRAASKLSNYISFDLDSAKFEITGLGDINHVRLSVPTADLDAVVPGEPLHSLFATDYIEDVSKTVSKSTGPLTIELGNAYPMRLTMIVGKVLIKYLVAPRLEHD